MPNQPLTKGAATRKTRGGPQRNPGGLAQHRAKRQGGPNVKRPVSLELLVQPCSSRNGATAIPPRRRESHSLFKAKLKPGIARGITRLRSRHLRIGRTVWRVAASEYMLPYCTAPAPAMRTGNRMPTVK